MSSLAGRALPSPPREMVRNVRLSSYVRPESQSLAGQIRALPGAPSGPWWSCNRSNPYDGQREPHGQGGRSLQSRATMLGAGVVTCCSRGARSPHSLASSVGAVVLGLGALLLGILGQQSRCPAVAGDTPRRSIPGMRSIGLVLPASGSRTPGRELHVSITFSGSPRAIPLTGAQPSASATYALVQVLRLGASSGTTASRA